MLLPILTYQVKPRVHNPFVPLLLGEPSVGVLTNEYLEQQGHWYPHTNHNQRHDLQTDNENSIQPHLHYGTHSTGATINLDVYIMLFLEKYKPGT